MNELQPQAPPTNGMVSSEQSRSIAEVQAAVIMAKQFPRDTPQAINRIRMACQRPTLAEAAMYTYARGGSDVSGPSIRMAEAIAQQWGNIQFGIRELSQANGESTVEAYAWDLESNARQVKVFQVPHVRYTKAGGAKKLTDPRDIYETVANNGARRLRACILGIIPGDVVDIAVAECENTMTVNVELTPAKIAALVKAFEGYGITAEMLKERMQRPMESITPAQYVSLTKIGNSLKDGMSKPSDHFNVPNAPLASDRHVSLTAAEMAQAKSEMEGGVTIEDIVKKIPNLNPKQIDELRGIGAPMKLKTEPAAAAQ
jgi:hypothetical protein